VRNHIFPDARFNSASLTVIIMERSGEEGSRMVTCPKCGSKISYWRRLKLTDWNAVTCPKCQSRLKVANRGTWSALGGIGGGTGAFILYWLIFRPFLLILWVAFVTWVVGILAMPHIVRLKLVPS
jgi:CXXC-20-CXXC protein